LYFIIFSSVSYLGMIEYVWLGTNFLQQCISSVAVVEFPYLRIFVIHVTKLQGAGSTSLRTRCLVFSVCHSSAFFLSFQNSILRHMDIKCTFLHNPSGSYFHIEVNYHSAQIIVLVNL